MDTRASSADLLRKVRGFSAFRYDWLRRYGAGYSTRINNILRAVMSRAR